MGAAGFVLGDAEAQLEPVLSAVRETFAIVDDGTRSVERTWLDTFDWRLHSAGLTLELEIDADQSTLGLTGPNGEFMHRVPATVEPPCGLEEFPPGALRESLEPVVMIRALLPVAQTSDVVRDLRVLNADEKTVVRLTVAASTQRAPASRPLPTRVTVTPLRGYQGQAKRVARAVSSVPGVTPSPGPQLATLLADTNRTPGDYTGKVTVTLNADMPASAALVVVLLQLLDTAEANVDGTIADVDPEFLHDLRIAVRRTRSALKLAGDALPADLAERFAPEFRWLGDLTTPTRDLDVYLLGLDDMASRLVAATAADLAPFRAHLRRRRTLERRKLVRGLRSARFTTLTRDWRESLAGLSTIEPARWPEPTIRDLAADRVRRAHRRVLKRGSAISAESPADALHDLRKRGKELRYLLEFFASLHDPGTQRRLVRDLKGLQDCLGAYQDGEVQAEAIRTYAAEMMSAGNAPPATLLAMGELTAHLDRTQRQARQEFADRFERFANPGNAKRVEALTTLDVGSTP